MTQRRYEGDAIVVHWDSSRCIHTGICLKTLPAVFNLDQRPWVDVTGADAETIAAAVERCPSGALGYDSPDGPGEHPQRPTTVVPWPNGPLWVRGEVEVRDIAGELFAAGPRVTLCRCGRSQNQPFCDLSHRDAGFKDNPRVMTTARLEAADPGEISGKPSA